MKKINRNMFTRRVVIISLLILVNSLLITALPDDLGTVINFDYPTDYSLVQVNSSDYWITNEGTLDNVADLNGLLDGYYIPYSGALHNVDLGTYDFYTLGDVGIGVTNPDTNLMIEKSSGADPMLLLYNPGTSADNSYLQFATGDTGKTLGSDGFQIGLGADTNAYLIQRENSDMIFKTNNDEKMRLLSNGNVGIGTTSPLTKFQVGEVGTASTTLGNIYIQSNSDNKAISIEENSGGESWQIGIDNTGDLNFLDSGSSTPSITFQDGGNVGIGTASPKSILDIESGTKFTTSTMNSALRLQPYSITNGDYGSAIVFGSSRTGVMDGSAIAGIKDVDDNDVMGLAFLYHGSGFESSRVEAMRISSSGNVGIGTASPTAGYKLDVAGSIKGQYLNVDSGTGNIIASFSSSGDAIGEIRIADSTKFTRLLGVGPQFKIMPNDGTEMAIFDGLQQEIYLKGDVGIGTTNPDYKLDVVGNFRITNNAESQAIAGLYNPNANGYGLYVEVGNDDNNKYALNVVTDSDSRFYVRNDGNVGIGTSSPEDKLNIFNDGGAAAGIQISSRYNPYIKLTENIAGGENTWKILTGITARDDFGIKQESSGLYPFFIKNNLNVGIGTTNPEELLHLHGIYPTLKLTDNLGGATIKLQAVGGTEARFGTFSNSDLNFYTNSNKVMTLLKGGNVGIGTTTPSSPLEVGTASAVGITVVDTARSDTEVVGLGDSAAGGGYVRIYDDEGSLKTLFRSYASDNVQAYFNAPGNVGIGTASPDYKLDVKVDAVSSSNYMAVTYSTIYGRFHPYNTNFGNAFTMEGNTAGGIAFIAPDNRNIRFFDGTTENVRIDGSGNVGIGTTSPDRRLHIYDNGNSEQMLIGRDSGIYGIGANSNGLNFWGGGYASNSVPEVVFNLDGNVGIGTTSPDTKLQVVGSTKLGDDNTNYASFATDGELTLTGTARVKKRLYIDANGIKAPGAKPATFVEDGLTGCWEFADEGVEANQQSVSGTLLIPMDMDRSVVPTMNIGWHADGVSPGNCKWQLEYLWRSSNEDVTAGAQETLTIVSTASATSNGLTIAPFSGMDLPSSTDQALFWKVTRLSADGQDTISDVTHLRGQFFEYTANSLGEEL